MNNNDGFEQWSPIEGDDRGEATLGLFALFIIIAVALYAAYS